MLQLFKQSFTSYSVFYTVHYTTAAVLLLKIGQSNNTYPPLFILSVCISDLDYISSLYDGWLYRLGHGHQMYGRMDLGAGFITSNTISLPSGQIQKLGK